MKEIFTMIQRNKSRKDGFVYMNGILKTNKTIQEIKDIIYEAWDIVVEEPNAIAREIELSNKNSANFARCDLIADIELVHVPDENEEMYASSDILMKYIDQNLTFVNNLEVVNILNISNGENLKKGDILKELNVYIAKGEENYIYYELSINKRDSKYIEAAIELISSIVYHR